MALNIRAADAICADLEKTIRELLDERRARFEAQAQVERLREELALKDEEVRELRHELEITEDDLYERELER